MQDEAAEVPVEAHGAETAVVVVEGIVERHDSPRRESNQLEGGRANHPVAPTKV